MKERFKLELQNEAICVYHDGGVFLKVVRQSLH